MGGERVAQQVRVNILVDASEFRPLLDDFADTLGRQGGAADADENVRGGFAGDQFGTLVAQVVVDRLARFVADPHDPCFIALAGDAQESALEVHHLQPRLAQLGQPQAGGVE